MGKKKFFAVEFSVVAEVTVDSEIVPQLEDIKKYVQWIVASRLQERLGGNYGMPVQFKHTKTVEVKTKESEQNG